MPVRIGKNTIELTLKPSIIGYGTAVGKKEAEGPLGKHFDKVFYDEFCGEETFEKAETHLHKVAVSQAIAKSPITKTDIDIAFAGDLLNQCIGSSFGMRDLKFNFAGLYGACSTMALSLALCAVFTESGAAQNALCATSSHFCSAERQYRMPLEYGGQRSQAAQWTVTGSGAAIVGTHREGYPYIDKVIFGAVRDMGITDPNNMGAAMAPAAAETIASFLRDTKTKPADYDMILTGDLGHTGSALLIELLRDEQDIDIAPVHKDCGIMIFDRDTQDTHSGGSGCGCSATVVCSKICSELKSGKLNNVLFVGTGALLSPTSTMQKESIPGIAHGVLLCSS